MWWPGKKRREEFCREQGRLKLIAEQKLEGRIKKQRDDEIAEYEKKQAEQAVRYFALPVYPTRQTCWACGYELSLGGGTVELTQDGTTNCFGYIHNEKYGGRRYLKVTCKQCAATFNERSINPERTKEIAPESEGDNE